MLKFFFSGATFACYNDIMPPFHHVLHHKMISKCLVAAVVWRRPRVPTIAILTTITNGPRYLETIDWIPYFVEFLSPKRAINPPEIRLIDDFLPEDEK